MSRASNGRGGALRPAALAMASALWVLLAAVPAQADRIKNGTAVFSGLDKITGRIISFKAALGETVQFGSLQVTPRACFTRPAKEAPLTDSFVEIDEVSAKHEFKRIFSGWMFAASPGLHGLEHPIYDIWMTGCETPGETVVDAPQTADAEAGAPAATGEAVSGAPAPDAPPTAAPSVPVAEAPKPKVVRRATRPPAPRPDAGANEAQRTEPRQRFFPTSQYTELPSRQGADISGRDPAAGGGK